MSAVLALCAFAVIAVLVLGAWASISARLDRLEARSSPEAAADAPAPVPAGSARERRPTDRQMTPQAYEEMLRRDLEGMGLDPDTLPHIPTLPEGLGG